MTKQIWNETTHIGSEHSNRRCANVTYMSKSVPCITTVDKMEIRRVTAEQSTHEEDVLSKILMRTNFGSLSMMLRQNFSPPNCMPTHNPKRKSCRSQNLSRTSSWALYLTTCVWFCFCRANSKFCHLVTDWDNTRLNIKLNKKWKQAFSIEVIIPLMVSRHTDAATRFTPANNQKN